MSSGSILTHTQPFNGSLYGTTVNYPGEPVPEETFTAHNHEEEGRRIWTENKVHYKGAHYRSD